MSVSNSNFPWSNTSGITRVNLCDNMIAEVASGVKFVVSLPASASGYSVSSRRVETKSHADSNNRIAHNELVGWRWLNI